MPPLWKIKPHTLAKHEILRRYLQAYYPKLASTRDLIVFVDGFAGPGVYAGGEDGSPVIALDALTRHSHLPNMKSCRFQFLFIEEDRARFEMLKATVDSRQHPPNAEVTVRHGTFEKHIGEAFDGLERVKDLGLMPPRPSFVMVDPFGVKGLPLDLLRRLAEFPKTELLVSLMYEPISRFLEKPGIESHLDGLFGTREWRDAVSLAPSDKKMFLSALYARQLGGIGMEHVRLFEMRDGGNRTEYFLAFATHHREGLRVMKDAMWKVDQSGGVTFSDFTAPSPEQATLFGAEPNHDQLCDLMLGRFAGQQGVPIETINEFVLVETAFRETHGRDVLRKAQKEGSVKVERLGEKKSKNYWGTGTRVTFPAL